MGYGICHEGVLRPPVGTLLCTPPDLPRDDAPTLAAVKSVPRERRTIAANSSKNIELNLARAAR